MPLTPQDIKAIATEVALQLSARPAAPQPLALLPFKLTVAQFAVATQHCADHIRRQIRCRHIKAEGKPYLIHARELAKFDVDVPLAHTRLNSAGLLPAAPTALPVSQPHAA